MTSTSSPKIVQHGTAGGTAINVDLSRIESSVAVRVQLSAAYTMLNSPGTPTRPSLTGASQSNLDFPRTVASGQYLTLLAGEAAALVTAGKASYA